MKHFFKAAGIVSSIAAFSILFASVTGFDIISETSAFSDMQNNIREMIPAGKSEFSKRRYVGLGGDVFGIKMYTEGIIVIGIDSVTTAIGKASPAEKAGIRNGDIITHINSEKISSALEMTEMLEKSNGREMTLTIKRNDSVMELKLIPVLSSAGKYKAGIWVRDSSAGIGTITFYDDERASFAGLGHGVCDIDTGRIMPLSDGQAVTAKVNGYYKSSAGNPGELCGIFSDESLGSLRANLESGIFGTLDYPSAAKRIPVALESEVCEGKAQIVATIDSSGPQYYDIEIVKVYPSSDRSTRNMIIKVTDSGLIEKTGGIVQGMSGSPIIQNSMLVGAVTHVFVNEPSQGYGIFASRMADALDETLNESAA
ncbi:MAG: SpoIVB peptidase [Clostridia bacterium]|nr:SpoIVB peptidase [Clostridia bacterium]